MDSTNKKIGSLFIVWVVLVVITFVSGYFTYKDYIADSFFLTPESNEKSEESIDYSIQNDDTDKDTKFGENIIEDYPEINFESSTEVYTSVDNFEISAPNLPEYQENSEESSDNSKTEEELISARLKIQKKIYLAELNSESTVYDLMKKISDKTDFSFSGKEYSGLGFFVEEIDGIKNNNKDQNFWIYYINGEKAKTGISNYTLQNDDVIEWKYEKEDVL